MIRCVFAYKLSGGFKTLRFYTPRLTSIAALRLLLTILNLSHLSISNVVLDQAVRGGSPKRQRYEQYLRQCNRPFYQVC